MGVLEVLSDPSWDPVEDLRRSYEGSGAAEEVSKRSSCLVFLLGEQKSGIKIGSLRTVTRNSEVQDGEDVLRRLDE